MKVRIVKVPQLTWYGDTELELQFPIEWNIKECPMAGHNLRPLSEGEIKEAFSQPIGTKRISELAREKEEAVIIFDDMTRPTRTYEIVPFVLEELKRGGISDDHIRFVDALGAHGADDRMDFVKKLGEDIVERYPVYNHNPFGNLTEIGRTSQRTPVAINSEVMLCDLKIGIGCIVPHPMAGFGGGAKIILPGVASIDTIRHNHYDVGGCGLGSTPHPSIRTGKVEGNVTHFDMEEAARMAGLDVKIDAIVNGRNRTCGLFVGDFVKEFREGLKMARKVYITQPAKDADVVVVNTYPKANEAVLGMWAGIESVKEGGSVVLIVQTPEQQITHYLGGKFGKKRGGRLYYPLPPWPRLGRLIVFSSYKVRDPFLEVGDPDSLIWAKTWAEVLEELKATHKGKLKVAVFPNAEIQYPPYKEYRPFA